LSSAFNFWHWDFHFEMENSALSPIQMNNSTRNEMNNVTCDTFDDDEQNPMGNEKKITGDRNRNSSSDDESSNENDDTNRTNLLLGGSSNLLGDGEGGGVSDDDTRGGGDAETTEKQNLKPTGDSNCLSDDASWDENDDTNRTNLLLGGSSNLLGDGEGGGSDDDTTDGGDAETTEEQKVEDQNIEYSMATILETRDTSDEEMIVYLSRHSICTCNRQSKKIKNWLKLKFKMEKLPKMIAKSILSVSHFVDANDAAKGFRTNRLQLRKRRRVGCQPVQHYEFSGIDDLLTYPMVKKSKSQKQEEFEYVIRYLQNEMRLLLQRAFDRRDARIVNEAAKKVVQAAAANKAVQAAANAEEKKDDDEDDEEEKIENGREEKKNSDDDDDDDDDRKDDSSQQSPVIPPPPVIPLSPPVIPPPILDPFRAAAIYFVLIGGVYLKIGSVGEDRVSSISGRYNIIFPCAAPDSAPLYLLIIPIHLKSVLLIVLRG
jgi:hypothetical protein